MSLVLTVYRASDYAAAKEKASEILDYMGKGHSLGIHTTDTDRPVELGETMPVCRVIVNQAHCFATGAVLIMRCRFRCRWAAVHGAGISPIRTCITAST
ncbi:hypothetical protein [Aliamphritea spongicola]|nr:hypothetical protein [Aliamphritea spongicola]